MIRRITGKIGHFLGHPGTIVVAAFLVRYGIFCYFSATGPYPIRGVIPTMGYETGQIARSLVQGRGYGSPLKVDTGPTAWMPPGYPFLLAGVFKLFGIFTVESYTVIKAFDCAFSALTVWVIWAIARRAFGTACGVTAGWMWTLLPSAIFYPVVWVWDTSLSALVLPLIVLASMHVQESKRVSAWAGCGALWGLGAMVNASIVSTLPFLLGWDAQVLRRKSAQWLKLTLVALLLFAVVIAPWFIRNYLVFHKLILFRSNFGLELWLGNNRFNPGVWSWWLHPNDDDGERRLYASMGEMAYMAMKQREAISWIREHPAMWREQIFRRFVDNWTGFDEPPNLTKARFYIAVGMLLEILFPMLGLLGGVLSYRRGNPYAFPLTATIFFFPVVYYLTHTSLRYRHPIDPVLCVLAGYTAVSAWGWIAALVSRKPASADQQQSGEWITAGK